LGNYTTNVNYGAWGSTVSIAPLSGFKASVYEGGVRVPFIIKEPASATAEAAPTAAAANTTSSSSPIKSFMFLTDLTPTFLDYANVPQSGPTYEGREVHPIMGKSIRPILNGSTEVIHGPDDPTGVEMFNNTAVFNDPWVALYDHAHGQGWELYNLETDPGQNSNVADQNPELLQQMTADYNKYAEKVGVVIPTGEKAEIQYSKIYPPLNQTQTVNLDEIIPPFKKPTGENLKYAMQTSF
jgi:arylsulfatase